MRICTDRAPESTVKAKLKPYKSVAVIEVGHERKQHMVMIKAGTQKSMISIRTQYVAQKVHAGLAYRPLDSRLVKHCPAGILQLTLPLLLATTRSYPEVCYLEKSRTK